MKKVYEKPVAVLKDRKSSQYTEIRRQLEQHDSPVIKNIVK